MWRRRTDHDDDWFATGQAREARGDFAAAEGIYRAAASDGRCPDGLAWHLLGRVLDDHLGREDAAETAFRRALEHGRIDAGADLGILLQRQGRLAEAEVAYRAAVDAGWEPGWAFLANVLSEQAGREDEAEHVCWTAIESGSLEAWDSLGVVLGRVPGREVDAENAFGHGIAAGSSYAWAALGLLLQRRPGREADAEQALRTAIDLGHTAMWRPLGRLLQRDALRRAEGEEAFRRAIGEGISEALADLGLLLAAQPGRRDDALAAYVAAVQADDDRAWLILATTLLEPDGIDIAGAIGVRGGSEDAEQSEAMYREQIAHGDGARWTELAELLALEGRTAEAVECFLHAAEHGNPDGFINAALLAGGEQRDTHAAEGILRAAVAEESTTAMLALAALLADRAATRGEARRLLQNAIDRGEDHAEIGLTTIEELESAS